MGNSGSNYEGISWKSSKSQAPNHQESPNHEFEISNFRFWSLFGAWVLSFGACLLIICQSMSQHAPKPGSDQLPRDVKIAIVAARFNAHIVDELLSGCLKRLKELQLRDKKITVKHVPGAFELPLAAKMLAKTKKFDAVICLGCVIRGDTPHFDYVAGECARGIQRVSLDETLPVIFGVLTTNTEQQARDRIDAGARAADAAAEMILLARGIRT